MWLKGEVALWVMHAWFGGGFYAVQVIALFSHYRRTVLPLCNGFSGEFLL